MVNFDNVTNKRNIIEHNKNSPQILDRPYRFLIFGDFESGKTRSLFNLISHQADIDKTHLYAKDPYKTKYHLLINKRERR